MNKNGISTLIRQILKDDGAAAKLHLSSGRPIAYCDDAISTDFVIREWPDGRRELINVDGSGNVTIVGNL